MFWEDVLVEESDENYPRPRAGHCAVGVSISTKICSVYFFVAFFCSLPTRISFPALGASAMFMMTKTDLIPAASIQRQCYLVLNGNNVISEGKSKLHSC